MDSKPKNKKDASYYRERLAVRLKNPEYRERYLAKTRENNRKRTSDPAYRQRLREEAFVRKYGISIEKRAEMIAAQGGACAVCGGMNPSGKFLSLDHCHETGNHRGLLCIWCNSALGHAKDSVYRLTLLSDYLEKHGTADRHAPAGWSRDTQNSKRRG